MVRPWVAQITSIFRPIGTTVNNYKFWHVLVVFAVFLPILSYIFLFFYRRCIAVQGEMKQTNSGVFSSFNFSTNMWTGLSSSNIPEAAQDIEVQNGDLSKQQSIRKPLRDFKSRPNLVPPSGALYKKPSPQPSQPPPPPRKSRADSELLLQTKIIDLGITAEPTLIAEALEACDNEVNASLAYVLQHQNLLSAPGEAPIAQPAPPPMPPPGPPPSAPSMPPLPGTNYHPSPSMPPPPGTNYPKPSFQPGMQRAVSPSFQTSPKNKKKKRQKYSGNMSKSSSNRDRSSNYSPMSKTSSTHSNSSYHRNDSNSHRNQRSGYQLYSQNYARNIELVDYYHNGIVE